MDTIKWMAIQPLQPYATVWSSDVCHLTLRYVTGRCGALLLAARWSNRVYPTNHSPALFILLYYYICVYYTQCHMMAMKSRSGLYNLPMKNWNLTSVWVCKRTIVTVSLVDGINTDCRFLVRLRWTDDFSCLSDLLSSSTYGSSWGPNSLTPTIQKQIIGIPISSRPHIDAVTNLLFGIQPLVFIVNGVSMYPSGHRPSESFSSIFCSQGIFPLCNRWGLRDFEVNDMVCSDLTSTRDSIMLVTWQSLY